MDEWTDGWMDGWTDGQMDGQMDRWTDVFRSTSAFAVSAVVTYQQQKQVGYFSFVPSLLFFLAFF